MMVLINILILLVSNYTLPLEFTLNQNYPNPFNPVTTITYSIPQTQKVTLKVFDILGNEIQL